MAACASCSADIAAAAKFCSECGAPQSTQRTDARVVRKTVTVLFSDLVGSTAIGERHDPEQVRAVLDRYFGAMQAVIESHGGTVEKFIGDAIMAVFGIPTLHEDDALRAVRAADGMRNRLVELNNELGAVGGPRIEIRTGVNTGEVVTGDGTGGRTLVTGDAVNTAARLEQAAAPGEVLLGELTWQLVRHAICAEATAPIHAKGKADAVSAHRLVSVAPSSRPARPGAGPLVGRDAELAELLGAWGAVVREGTPRASLVLGAAGVGKSRLVDEVIARLEAATVLRGTCLPYGEGITYWPVTEVIRVAAGLSEADSTSAARVKLDRVLDGEPDARAIASRIAEAIGLEPAGSPQAEIFWAVRRALQWLARDRPLLVVWDDLQWAEPTFRDLVSHLATELRDAPVLLLLMARPELLEPDAAWASRLRMPVLELGPLDTDAAEDLIAAMPGGGALPPELRDRIAATAEGNPLFVEEMLAMLVDDGHLVEADDGWLMRGDVSEVGVPPTITALLSARIDRLARDERTAAQRASVVGRSFESSAIVALSPPSERPFVEGHLRSLHGRQLMEPDPDSALGGVHRFRHLLIRDAAYAALPKQERAALHEALASWLERIAGERVGEIGALVAHHLAEAYRYHLELGTPPAAVERLGRRAATSFASAAQQAFGRGDIGAATALRRRAMALPLAPPDRIEVIVQEVRSAVDRGDMADARRLLDDIASMDPPASERLEQRVRIARAYVAVKSAGASPKQADIDDVRNAADVLEALDDPAGVAMALDLYAFATFFAGDTDAAGSAWRAAADWATRSGDRAEQARVLPAVPATFTYGWSTTSESIAYCRELLDAHPDSPMLESRSLAIMAGLYLELDEVDHAIALRTRSRAILNELGVPWMRVELAGTDFEFEATLGNWEAAERAARTSYELAKEFGWRVATAASNLFEANYRRGRLAEAERWLQMAEEDVKDDVADTAAFVRSSRALLMAARGERVRALDIVSEPVPEAFEPSTRAWLHEMHGEAAELLGEPAIALEQFERAAAIYRRKEANYSLAKVTAQIARLSALSGEAAT